MIAIITEKPSVGKDIARVLNIDRKGDGYMFNEEYCVTWALGHLVSLALPVDYGAARISVSDIPLIPEPFRLVVRRKKAEKGYITDSQASRQLKIIESVLKKCDSIIVATDAGREGELIFRYIYSYLDCKLPFQRLWINSLTDEAIIKGFRSLKAGGEYDKLFYSSDCRAKADWLIGINASQSLCIVCGMGNNSIGRVQTPTLAMICSRYLENKSFLPKDYWQIKMSIEKEGVVIHFSSRGDFTNVQSAQKRFEELKKIKQARITKVIKKEVKEQPPLLYDLTELQKDASNIYDFSSERTLEIAQKLYENKLISYPRTSSRYIPDDVFSEIPALITNCKKYKSFSGLELFSTLNDRSVNNKKITDHHALLPTMVIPEILSNEEKAIYSLIVYRMFEAFSPLCLKEVTNVEADADGLTFVSTGTRIIRKGWRVIQNKPEENENDNQLMPDFSEEEILNIGGYNMVGKKTKPKPFYTEATLLTAMENCGKELENGRQREIMKELGIGTAATRASIISVLFKRNYIQRSGKSIIPTDKGLFIYEAVKDMKVADVELTGGWEKDLKDIENGLMLPETFMNSIGIFTSQACHEILKLRINLPGVLKCPKCNQNITINKKVARCMNDKCRFIIFRTFLNKELTEQHIQQLISSGKTKLIKGFRGRKDSQFDAHVAFDDEYNTILVFPESTRNKSRRKR